MHVTFVSDFTMFRCCIRVFVNCKGYSNCQYRFARLVCRIFLNSHLSDLTGVYCILRLNEGLILPDSMWLLEEVSCECTVIRNNLPISLCAHRLSSALNFVQDIFALGVPDVPSRLCISKRQKRCNRSLQLAYRSETAIA